MPLGAAELVILLGCALCGLVFPVGLLVVMVITANQEWSAEHAGQPIVLQNTFLSESLYIDGQLVDSHSGLTFENTLRGRIGDGADAASVEGQVRQGMLGMSIKGKIVVDGTPIGGDVE